MKEFFEKHNLLGIIGIAFVFILLLTWIIPTGYFNGVEFISSDIRRIGLNDMFLTGVYSVNYFVLQLTYLLVIGGFYGLATKVPGYKTLVAKIAKVIKGKEEIAVILISLIFAVVTSLLNDAFLMVFFVPFAIAILRNAKVSKVVAFASTFGGILIGVIGATYSSAAYSFLNEYIGTEIVTLIWIKIIVFFAAFIIFNLFTVLYMRKVKAKKDEEKELFTEEFKVDKKSNPIPVIIVMAVMFVFMVLGFMSWHTNFQINVFNDFHTWLTGFTINLGGEEHAIFTYILGNGQAFGTWDLSAMQMIILLAYIPMFILSKQSLSDNFSSIGEGLQKITKLVLIVVLVNSIFLLIYWSPITATMANFVMNLADSFNVFLATIVGIITSIFHIDYAFTGYSLGAWFAGSYGEFTDIIMIVLTTTRGLVQFVAPTSIVLMLGLAYSDIKYTTWFKYVWKFVVVMLAVLVILFTILTYAL